MRITYILMALALAFSTASTADDKLNQLKHSARWRIKRRSWRLQILVLNIQGKISI